MKDPLARKCSADPQWAAKRIRDLNLKVRIMTCRICSGKGKLYDNKSEVDCWLCAQEIKSAKLRSTFEDIP